MDVTRKQGVVFSVIALLIATFFTAMFSTPAGIELPEREQTASFRINILDRYMSNFNTFTEQAIRVTAHDALHGMVGQMNHTGNYFSTRQEIENALVTCMMNGTINTSITASKRNCSWKGKRPMTLPERMSQMVRYGESNMSLDVSFDVKNITLQQNYPFHVTITTNYTIMVSDPFATLQSKEKITTLVDLDNLHEPLYEVKTTGRRIRETTIQPDEWSNDTVAMFIKNESYRYYNGSPSFMQRMQGLASANSECCGIESILTEVTDNITIQDKTINASTVDHLYYRVKYKGLTMQCDNVRSTDALGVPEAAVQVDEQHLTLLNVSSDVWNTDCNP